MKTLIDLAMTNPLPLIAQIQNPMTPEMVEALRSLSPNQFLLVLLFMGFILLGGAIVILFLLVQQMGKQVAISSTNSASLVDTKDSIKELTTSNARKIEIMSASLNIATQGLDGINTLNTKVTDSGILDLRKIFTEYTTDQKPLITRLLDAFQQFNGALTVIGEKFDGAINNRDSYNDQVTHLLEQMREELQALHTEVIRVATPPAVIIVPEPAAKAEVIAPNLPNPPNPPNPPNAPNAPNTPTVVVTTPSEALINGTPTKADTGEIAKVPPPEDNKT